MARADDRGRKQEWLLYIRRLIMVIESRTIVGAAGAFAIVAAGVWFSLAATTPARHAGTVEVQQIQEPSWTVEVKDVSSTTSNDIVKTAATR